MVWVFAWLTERCTVVILDFHHRVLTNGSHLLSFQPMTTKIGIDEGLPIGIHLVPRKLTSASTRPHWRPFSWKIMNLKTVFGSSEGLISRLQMHNKWSSNSHRPWVHTHFSKAWFFMKMASSEAMLRLRSTFLVPNGYLLVSLHPCQFWCS